MRLGEPSREPRGDGDFKAKSPEEEDFFDQEEDTEARRILEEELESVASELSRDLADIIIRIKESAHETYFKDPEGWENLTSKIRKTIKEFSDDENELKEALLALEDEATLLS